MVQLSQKAINILGVNGEKRYRSFCTYQEGWHMGTGSVLSTKSLENMEEFFNKYGYFCDDEPSLFLSLYGNLQLNWEDKEDKRIEIEFFSDLLCYQ